MSTLTGEVGNVKKLKATISPQGNLQASITQQKVLHGAVLINTVPVDSELSHTSTNPVQNKVVTEALEAKMPVIKIAKNTDIDKLFV